MDNIVQAMMGAAGQGGGLATDPNFNQTVLLLHGDGTNGAQNNTFLDSSTNNFTITRNGNVTQGSFSPFSRSSGNLVTPPYDPAVHGGSGYFDGTGDYLTVATGGAFGTSSWTIEAWVYRTATGTTRAIFDHNTGVASSTGFSFVVNSSEQLGAYWDSAYQATVNNFPSNQWVHVAATYDGTNLRLFVNGALGATSAETINFTTDDYFIGSSELGQRWLGYISDMRIVVGTALYTTTFTPPTAPLTAVSGTELLCNFTNAGIFDNTGKNNLETVGNAQIDTATKKYGTGSMEFDGTGDWLKVPNSPDLQLGTGDFTIEFWVYLATGDAGSARGLVAKGGASTGWLVSLDSSEKVVFTYTTSTITSSGAITTNAWNHIAVVREGTGSNETKIYIGGTNDGTGTVSTNFNQTEVMYIGANRAAGDPMKGFIDDLRITKGVARYTANFTPPTAAFPDL